MPVLKVKQHLYSFSVFLEGHLRSTARHSLSHVCALQMTARRLHPIGGRLPRPAEGGAF